MTVFGINCGHTKSGFGTGAVGIIAESEHTRLVGYELMRLIRESGHKAVDCTIDYAKNTNESLSKIMDVANNVELDWFVSIHFNAGGGRGTEVYTYEGRQYEDTLEVCANIEKLGFKNRGVKAGTGLYVIRKTKAKSMLIEVCFVDTEDANHYLSLGYKAIAKAIAEALVGYVERTQPKPSIVYEAHVQDIGWQGKKRDGEPAGTTGKSLRLEALTIKLENTNAKLEMQGHIEGKGWTSIRTDGEVVGTMGESLRLEAIAIKGIGVSVTYRVHAQDIGWTNWVRDGEIAGTVGESKRIEAIEIKLV